MIKKQFAFLGLAVLAGLSLASCGGDEENTSKPTNEPTEPSSDVTPTETPTVDPSVEPSVEPTPVPTLDYDQEIVKASGDVDVYVNYQAKQGISLIAASYYNKAEDVTYTKGDLLPTWKCFAEKVGVTIRDASTYGDSKDDDAYTTVSGNGYKDDIDQTRNIDLFYNTTKNINKMGNNGDAVDLTKYLDKMPNFKAYLDKYPSVKKTIMSGEAMYYPPYMDGFNDIEKMHVMDTDMVAKVLDANPNNMDTVVSGKGGAANTVQGTGYYKPFMDPSYNYPEKETEIAIVNADGEADTITVKQTTNIILQQNNLLANGCTGKELAKQFQDYLNVAYADAIDNGVYDNLSEIFTGQSAAYNTDELIALMRVIKANPKTISGDETVEVETLFPRGQANNRVDNILDFASIWGVQGLVGEKDNLYFAFDGTLNDAHTTEGTWDALDYLQAIYNEGLILTDFYKKDQGKGTAYVDRYWGKKTEMGYGFMVYDYCASTCASNDIVNGIGTKAEARVEAAQGMKITGLMPVIHPVSWWGFTNDWSVDQALNNHNGKVLARFTEDNRALKSNYWCIPTNTDNLDGALALMDLMFTEEGLNVQDYGPDNGKYWTPGYVNGVEGVVPVISDALKEMIGSSGTDFWSFYRGYIGSTHGIGHERSKSIDIQASNYWAQEGLGYVKKAIATGVVNLALIDKVAGQYTYDTSVPTAGYPTLATEVTNSYEFLTDFFSATKCGDTATGWVKYVTASVGTDLTNETMGTAAATGAYTLAQAKAQMSVKNDAYLKLYARALDESCVPSYLK